MISAAISKFLMRVSHFLTFVQILRPNKLISTALPQLKTFRQLIFWRDTVISLKYPGSSFLI